MISTNSHLLKMEDIEPYEGFIHIVVEPTKALVTMASTNYATAKNNCTSYTSQGFLINITPETLQKLRSGEISELTI